MSSAPDRGRLWVVTECYPRPGAPGACAFAHRQMTGVLSAGYDVRVLVPNGWFPPVGAGLVPYWRESRGRAIPRNFVLDGIPVSDLRFQSRFPSRLSRPRETGDRIAMALERVLRASRVRRGHDVLMAQFALPYGPFVSRAAAAAGIPHVVQLRGDDVWIWPHRRPDRMRGFVEALRHAALVTAVSRSLIDEAARLCDGHFPPSAVVPNGIDVRRFRPVRGAAEREAARREIGIDPGNQVILCVGAALVRKGWLELLDAAGALARPGRDLTLVGVTTSRFDEVDIAREAANRAPGIELRLLQDVDHERLAVLHRAADVFCLPSHWEGLSNAVLEAMASGLPVVTTSIAGHPEVVSDGVEGLLVPPADRDALGRALGAVLDDAERAAAMGRAGALRARAVGDSRKAGRRLADLLDAVRQGDDGSGLDAAWVRRSPYALPEALETV